MIERLSQAIEQYCKIHEIPCSPKKQTLLCPKFTKHQVFLSLELSQSLSIMITELQHFLVTLAGLYQQQQHLTLTHPLFVPATLTPEHISKSLVINFTLKNQPSSSDWLIAKRQAGAQS